MSRVRKLMRVWAAVGGVALVVFVLWMLIGYRASAEAHAAMRSDESVQVTGEDDGWRFRPARGGARRSVGLVFFPGALVDPRAYAPLLRDVAAAGHPTILVAVPGRGAFGTADRPEVRGRARRLMGLDADVDAWVAAGHSRGAKVAALLARDDPTRLAGLALIGSTHPRDFSLAALQIPVTKIYGGRDGVAPRAAVEANRHLLPAATSWVLIDGGNHSQFGSYGFQPLDRFADIERAEQQRRTVAALLELLGVAEASAR